MHLFGGRGEYEYWLPRSCYLHVVDYEMTCIKENQAPGPWTQRTVIGTRNDLPLLFGRTGVQLGTRTCSCSWGGRFRQQTRVMAPGGGGDISGLECSASAIADIVTSVEQVDSTAAAAAALDENGGGRGAREVGSWKGRRPSLLPRAKGGGGALLATVSRAGVMSGSGQSGGVMRESGGGGSRGCGWAGERRSADDGGTEGVGIWALWLRQMYRGV